MSLLTKTWDCARTVVTHLWNGALDVGWSVWNEITEGAYRLSWWVLLCLVWFEGLAVGWWLWNS
jgi:hypothetical protein